MNLDSAKNEVVDGGIQRPDVAARIEESAAKDVNAMSGSFRGKALVALLSAFTACAPMSPLDNTTDAGSADSHNEVAESANGLPAFGFPEYIAANNKGIELSGKIESADGKPVSMTIRVLDGNGKELQSFVLMLPNGPYTIVKQFNNPDQAKIAMVEDGKGKDFKVDLAQQENIPSFPGDNP